MYNFSTAIPEIMLDKFVAILRFFVKHITVNDDIKLSPAPVNNIFSSFMSKMIKIIFLSKSSNHLSKCNDNIFIYIFF